ncbi:MAG TPA: bifunctional molybdenum cofactor biosynthesis protein MoaC/MoaB [candidate division Zixibacteria bacterium]|nr:bifunctional molybdenum cofactor biosynthesis protein MoaC/MoaB [candidate division Zixibacteria bacterium]
MIDVSSKSTTLRRAKAQAVLAARSETIQKVNAGSVPKGNVLELARAAATLAAKRTSELIPLCHPIPLDQVTVEFETQADAIVVLATVQAVWKTGVEMEALVAASTGALTIYDMLKPIDQSLEIRSIKLTEKRGGKSDFADTFGKPLRAAVVVTSDGTYSGTRTDKSGKLIVEMLKPYAVEPAFYEILPDEKSTIEKMLVRLCDEEHCDLVFTTGGTGLGPRDITVEATEAVIETLVPGIVETARGFGQNRNPYAMLSRALAGIRGKTLVVNLPGSSNGVRESLQALLPGLLHAFKMMAGGGHKE